MVYKPSSSFLSSLPHLNRSAICLALLILVATIIVVPILYTLKKDTTTGNGGDLSWNSTGTTIAGYVGANGTANDSLTGPWGLAFDSSNSLYIADRLNNRIQKWVIGDKSGKTVAGHSNGTAGSTDDSLSSPYDVFVDSNLAIYVADTGNHRIQLWQNGATSGKMIAGTGIAGGGNNELNQPRSITLDSKSSTLYIADYGNNRVMRYSLGSSSGSDIADDQQNGVMNTYLNGPIGLRFDSLSNSLVIAQETNYNVVRWALNASSWTLVAGSVGGDLSGSTRTLFQTLCGVICDNNGHTYVADCNNQRIVYFTKDLAKGMIIAGVTGAGGNSLYLLNNPTAVALDSNYNLYVSDTNNSRIQKFAQKS